MHLVRPAAENKIFLFGEGVFLTKRRKDKSTAGSGIISFSVSTLSRPKRKISIIDDVRKPLPYPDQIFDAVYLFHILEHLTPEEARTFLREIYRVLKFSGIVRISTPDLEDICRAYVGRLKDYEGSSTEEEPTEIQMVRIGVARSNSASSFGRADERICNRWILRSTLCKRALWRCV